ncbi:MAG: type VI secretion system baseplate subunit TssF [Holosporales bacterium]|nr:type VI secretion system baseplate subunit TssF [Holosporales bacterium]
MTSNEFLDYYYGELGYLRNAGAIFAKDYPDIAGRLKLDAYSATDPHVERLIESFAFLAARLQHNIDNVAMDVTDALLDVLVPHLNRPLPSMTIAQFRANAGGSAPPPSGFPVKRHTELFTYSANDNICKFRTVYPLTLYPLILENVAIVSHGAYRFVPVPNTIQFNYQTHNKPTTYFLELTLRSKNSVFSDLDLKELCFYLNINDDSFAKQLYQAIFSARSLIYCSKKDESVALPMLPGSLAPLGLERDEMAVPPLPHETHAYQLLQEFFHFREKFMFFKLQKLDFLRYLRNGNFVQTNGIKLLIPLEGANSDWARKIGNGDVLVNCTPIVNLHKVTTDPISWDQKQTSYHLLPNAQKNRTMEIYQIDDVFAINTENGEEKRLCPYFSLENHAEEDVFWWSKSVPTRLNNVTGVDSLIYFVDPHANSINPEKYVVYAKTLCTNRFLAEDIQQNTQLQAEMAIPANRVICLQKPVFPQYSLDRGPNNARLIAQLSSNYLGFPYDERGNIASNIKCILDMHIGANNREYGQTLLAQLENVSATDITKHLGHEAWRGFVDGIEIQLRIRQSVHTGDWFLLSQILHRYFAMNCQVNAFVDLTLCNENEVIATFDGIWGDTDFI